MNSDIDDNMRRYIASKCTNKKLNLVKTADSAIVVAKGIEFSCYVKDDRVLMTADQLHKVIDAQTQDEDFMFHAEDDKFCRFNRDGDISQLVIVGDLNGDSLYYMKAWPCTIIAVLTN